MNLIYLEIGILVYRDLPKPIPKDNEVLIKIYATTVTASDVVIRGLNAHFMVKFFLQLMMGFGKPRIPILGMALSGVVEGTGNKV